MGAVTFSVLQSIFHFLFFFKINKNKLLSESIFDKNTVVWFLNYGVLWGGFVSFLSSKTTFILYWQLLLNLSDPSIRIFIFQTFLGQ